MPSKGRHTTYLPHNVKTAQHKHCWASFTMYPKDYHKCCSSEAQAKCKQEEEEINMEDSNESPQSWMNGTDDETD